MSILPFKRCSKCGELKLKSEFHKASKSKDGYAGICKSCTYIRTRNWALANPERRREFVRQYKDRNAERVKEKDRLAHRERYAQNPEKYKAINQKWVSTHLDKKIAVNNNRRAREKMCVGKVTAAEWAALLDKYNHACLCCGRSDVKLTRDHVVPLDNGGTNTISNIQPLCASCNSKKGTKRTDYR